MNPGAESEMEVEKLVFHTYGGLLAEDNFITRGWTGRLFYLRYNAARRNRDLLHSSGLSGLVKRSQYPTRSLILSHVKAMSHSKSTEFSVHDEPLQNSITKYGVLGITSPKRTATPQFSLM